MGIRKKILGTLLELQFG